jgi:hypothetical protein
MQVLRRKSLVILQPRHVALVLAVATTCLACHRTTPSPQGAGRRVPMVRVVKRDSSGRALPTGSSIDRDASAAVDARAAHVRVLRVIPDRLTARVGDTLAPSVAFEVFGLDSAGRVIPGVTPLFGPLPPGGAVTEVRPGRWLAAKAGVARIGVRVMRFSQPPSEDTALVRTVIVDVVP